MPRKTQAGGKTYPEDSMIYAGPPAKFKENPADYPTVKTLNSWLSANKFAIKNTNLGKDGFLLNAKESIAKDKASLDYNKKAFRNYNDKTTPYFIGFSQWFYDGAWMGNEPGWVTISFDKNYLPQDAIVNIRLGGYGHMFGGGSFDVAFEGKIISVPHTAGYNNYQAVTIPLIINKSHPNRKRTSPLGKITISARELGSWKFFDAKYDSLQKVIFK